MRALLDSSIIRNSHDMNGEDNVDVRNHITCATLSKEGKRSVQKRIK